jgi:hypothetical protein
LGLDEAFCDTGTTNPPVQIDPGTSTKFGGDRLALGSSTGGGVGGADPLPPALWPETVSMIMYPAGTFFRARMNLVNLEAGLLDSALLSRNQRVVLFLEEAASICKRCYDSLYITVRICASGQTGGGSATHPDCGVAPPPPPPAPVVTVREAAGDPNHMTVEVLVDNHGNGPVTVAWGQTPALPDGTNAGDGVAVTTRVYTQEGAWTITATDADNPALTATATATVPFAGAPAISLTVTDTAPPSRAWEADWDNFGQGPVTVSWGDGTPDESHPAAGTATHTYDNAVVGPVTVTVRDTSNPTRTTSQEVTLPPPV